jgi:hypothetical protein
MKICPNCRQTYTDDNLNFCLTDGSFLTEYIDIEPKTVLLDQTRVTNQTNFGEPNYQPPAVWQNQQNLQNQQTGFPARIQQPSQTLPTISLVLGILALLTSCCFGGIPTGAAAIIIGVVAINQEKSDPTRYGGRGLALAGLITGGVGFIIGMGFLILAIIAD